MRVPLAVGCGVLAALVVAWTGRSGFHVEAGTNDFARLVAGAARSGLVTDRAIAVLPGLERASPRDVLIRVEPPRASRSSLGIGVDGGPIEWRSAHRDGSVLLRIPAAPIPGARIELQRPPGEEFLRLLSIRVVDAPPVPYPSAALSGIATALLVFLVALRRPMALGAAIGLLAGAGLALASAPASLCLALPPATALARLAPPVGLALASLAIAFRRSRSERRFYRRAASLLAIGIFGLWVRCFFLPSAGSWDTDIWKAWMLRSASHGLTRVYGDPGSIPEGRFWAQMRGEEIPWRIPHAGRLFVVDYPPLSMLLWEGSWRSVNALASGLDYGEAQNVAVKLPAVLGDAAALFILLWALRDRPDRGVRMAALYWALPVSWLSSAVLGYHDGALAPLAVAALVAAARQKGFIAGLLLSLAVWVKPLAVLFAPAVLAGLASGGNVRRNLGRAALAGLAVSAGVVLPYLWSDTIDAMVVHVYRLFAPGNLSSGYANVWWILGQGIAASREAVGWTGRVPFVRLEEIDLPLFAIATPLFAIGTAWACFLERRSFSPNAILLSAATAYFAYSFLALGVFENHPHLMFLALLATGLPTRRLQALFAATAATYVLNLFLLGGIGRFYGLRYWILEGWAAAAAGVRMAPGFDLTLVLAAINTAVFALWLAWLPREMKRAGESEDVVGARTAAVTHEGARNS